MKRSQYNIPLKGNSILSFNRLYKPGQRSQSEITEDTVNVLFQYAIQTGLGRKLQKVPIQNEWSHPPSFLDYVIDRYSPIGPKDMDCDTQAVKVHLSNKTFNQLEWLMEYADDSKSGVMRSSYVCLEFLATERELGFSLQLARPGDAMDGMKIRFLNYFPLTAGQEEFFEDFSFPSLVTDSIEISDVHSSGR